MVDGVLLTIILPAHTDRYPFAIVGQIEKQARGLDEITKSAETIRNGSDKILDRARIMRDALGKQIAFLGEKVGDLKSILEGVSG